MNRQKLSQQVMWAILTTLLLVGCGAPAATPTPIPPTATLTPVPPIEVTFDGNECTVSGPPKLPVGEYKFIFKNLSGKTVDLNVIRLTDGRTYQDLLDLQSEPGEYIPEPSWIVGAIKRGTEWNESKGEKVYTFSVEEGEHAIEIWVNYPAGIWFCAPLKVIEAPE